MENNRISAEELATDPTFVDWVKYPNPTNTAFWEAWLARHPDKADEVRLARQLINLWCLVPPVPSPGSQATVWATIRTATTASKKQPLLSRKPLRLNQPHHRRWAAALVGLTMIITGAFWMITNWGMTRYATNAGETQIVTLPDSSTVILNANSSVRFASVWTLDQPRRVNLTGEGFFAVTHQKNHQKFIVQTSSGLQVEVLGTRFTVDGRRDQTRVVLNQGKVCLRLADQREPIMMKPGELVEVSGEAQKTIVHRRVIPEVYSAWTENQFVFDNTSLTEIAAVLERDFGQTVEFANPALGRKRMTIRLTNRDLDVLLVAIAEANDVTVNRMSDNHIRIQPN